MGADRPGLVVLGVAPWGIGTGIAMEVTIIGAALSPIAAMMAFLITYEEYSHHSPDKKWVFMAALRTALVTLVFFVGLAVGIGLFIEKVVLK